MKASIDISVDERHVFHDWDDKIYGSTERECMVCKALTRWVDISFEGPMCSPECDRHMTREWMEANRLADERWEELGGLLDLVELTVEALPPDPAVGPAPVVADEEPVPVDGLDEV